MERFTFPSGVQDVIWGVSAAEGVGSLVERYGYERLFVVASRTLSTTTSIVDDFCAALSDRIVAHTARVGQHAPLSNVVRGIALAREVGADAVVSIGGGSVLNFGKVVQLGVSAGVETVDDIRALSEAPRPVVAPTLRQVAVPTTLSTAEWTSFAGPLDDTTGRRIPLMIPSGAPRGIVYDPDLLLHTPRELLLATGIRGLDHAINNVLSSDADGISTALSLAAIARYPTALRAIAAHHDDAMGLALVQEATRLTGMTQSSVAHGFSHHMVHVLAPWAGTGHGASACVMMLGQARWFAGEADDRLRLVVEAMGGAGETLDVALECLLIELGLPTTLGELGVDPDRLDDLADRGAAHPPVTHHNLRPIRTREDVRAVLESVR